MDIQLSFAGNQLNYYPGDLLRGFVNWNLSAPPSGLEVRLLWFTRGKGNRDMQIVATIPIANRSAMGDAPFEFRLPQAPHSFSGRLLSLVWAVEAIVLTSEKGTHVEIVVSPTGQELVLTQPEPPDIPLKERLRQNRSVEPFGSDNSTWRP